MANVIKIKNSGTANSAPTSLEYGEIAINYNDGFIFFKDSSNTIISFDISGTFSTAQLTDDLNDLEVSIAMQTF